MSKLDKLPVKKEVIHKLAIGESQTSIAGQVGVGQSTISRFANQDEAIRAIEEEQPLHNYSVKSISLFHLE